MTGDLRCPDIQRGLAVVELLVVEGVCKGFARGGQWTETLQDVAFEVQRGEVAAVIGSRLEGKTTLLKIAAGMERPDRGSISLAGQELTGLRDRPRTKLLGHQIVWVDRDGPGLNVEVTKFVGWPLALHGHGRRDTERAAARALERVGARECRGRHWGELSNWQRLLVALARAFAGEPQLVVIDDLLDALGARATEHASDLLRSLIEESTPRCAVLMSASDIESAIFADHIWTFTRKGTLKPLAPHTPNHGEIIPFPKHADVDDA